MIERRPFSGQCQSDVKNKLLREWSGGKDLRCGRITDIVQEGEWRCGYHLNSAPAFAVKGQFFTPRSKSKQPYKHGVGAYRHHGCRCDTCRGAVDEYERKRRQRQREHQA